MTTVLRVEVMSAPGHPDPMAVALKRDAAGLGVGLSSARSAHVYLIEPDARSPISREQMEVVCRQLLADPVTEVSHVGARAASPGERIVEVHPLPGVMDPVAESVQAAIVDVLGLAHLPQVATGWRYDLAGPALTEKCVRTLGEKLLANPVIQRATHEAYLPASFATSKPHTGGMRRVPICGLGASGLEALSRDAHLFLTLEEMRAVQAHYQSIGCEPREIELETLAQTWSEHCVHKTLKAEVRYRSGGATEGRSEDGRGPSIRWGTRPGHEVHADGSVTIKNLLKSTIAAATFRLIEEGVDWTLSVFSDNSGVIAFDDEHAVCIKVETHNRPSAIEPYGGAATGIGGCIRDVVATGLGALPIASTDTFCVAPMDGVRIPDGCIEPRRILTQVVAGIRDYGNRMGIPTVAGGVYVDPRHVGNPLVFAGCIGVMPRTHTHGQVRSGDLIVAVGGRTGRDGIHGATFSSAEISHTAADEFAHAVQIGNAITEKRALDAIMRAREADGGRPLFSALTDCGAGGFSSAIGELGKSTGATVHLDRAPLKYAGLSPTEIWISEAQERFILAVPEEQLAALKEICGEESVELAVLGTFAPPSGSSAAEPDLLLMHNGEEVGRLSMHLLHDGIPTPTREAVWRGAEGRGPWAEGRVGSEGAAPKATLAHLRAVLAHPNVASKHWIIRQYDHEVRGGTAVKPLVGPLGRGPSDASVVYPIAGSMRGIAIGQGLQTPLGDPALEGDAYQMALAAIDECVRNLVCVGADPSRIAILDNFCWPSCKKPENLGALVRACEGCYDGAMAYRTPFVSGKDSLHNEFTTKDGVNIAIPPTLLITGLGIVSDVGRAVTMDAKRPGNVIIRFGPCETMGVRLRGSHMHMMSKALGIADAHFELFPTVDLKMGPSVARCVSELIRSGVVQSAHDVSDGGVLVALAEMLIGGSSVSRPLGASVSDMSIHSAFGEGASTYLLEVSANDFGRVQGACEAGMSASVVAIIDDSGALRLHEESVDVEKLATVWRGTLDW